MNILIYALRKIENENLLIKESITVNRENVEMENIIIGSKPNGVILDSIAHDEHIRMLDTAITCLQVCKEQLEEKKRGIMEHEKT